MQLALILIAIILLSGYSLLLLYFRRSWKTIPDFEAPTPNLQPPTTNFPLISLIIPARNEEKNIVNCLDSISVQSYPRQYFEVLIVDDNSTDRTAELVSSYKAENIKLISLSDYLADPAFNSFKKKAIETGISKSLGELIVTSDADCLFPADWLQTIAGYYEANKPEFMVMPVRFQTKNNFLEIFQSLDFMSLQGITGAAVNKRLLSMCNGANLAYTRKAFQEVGGFEGIDHIASGDDMLLMHKIYNLYPGGIKFVKSGELIVTTLPMHTLKDFLHQRIRWASKAVKYDDKRIFAVLLLVYLLNLWCLLMSIAAIFYPAILYGFLGMIALKTLMEMIFLYPVARFFRSASLLWWFPLAQPFHILYTIIAGWLGKFGTYQWKGRKVN